MSHKTPALIVAAVTLAGCGGGEESTGEGLEWSEQPVTTRAPTGGTDQVVVGQLRNATDEHIELVAERVRVVDAEGDPVQSDARFVATFVHGLYGADVRASDLPYSERSRLGLTIVLEPGGTTPVYAAFRADSAAEPLALTVAGESLDIPPASDSD